VHSFDESVFDIELFRGETTRLEVFVNFHDRLIAMAKEVSRPPPFRACPPLLSRPSHFRFRSLSTAHGAMALSMAQVRNLKCLGHKIPIQTGQKARQVNNVYPFVICLKV
jgi:dynein heavy chain 1